jgi:hypothetical protein
MIEVVNTEKKRINGFPHETQGFDVNDSFVVHGLDVLVIVQR